MMHAKKYVPLLIPPEPALPRRWRPIPEIFRLEDDFDWQLIEHVRYTGRVGSGSVFGNPHLFEDHLQYDFDYIPTPNKNEMERAQAFKEQQACKEEERVRLDRLWDATRSKALQQKWQFTDEEISAFRREQAAHKAEQRRRKERTQASRELRAFQAEQQRLYELEQRNRQMRVRVAQLEDELDWEGLHIGRWHRPYVIELHTHELHLFVDHDTLIEWWEQRGKVPWDESEQKRRDNEMWAANEKAWNDHINEVAKKKINDASRLIFAPYGIRAMPAQIPSSICAERRSL